MLVAAKHPEHRLQRCVFCVCVGVCDGICVIRLRMCEASAKHADIGLEDVIFQRLCLHVSLQLYICDMYMRVCGACTLKAC